jgi:hypothetical protein
MAQVDIEDSIATPYTGANNSTVLLDSSRENGRRGSLSTNSSSVIELDSFLG